MLKYLSLSSQNSCFLNCLCSRRSAWLILTVHYCYKKIVLLRTLSQNLSRLFHCSVIKVLCSFHLFETASTLYQSCSNLSRTFLIHHNRKFAEHTFYYMYIICCPIDLFVSRSRQLVHNIICSDKCQHLFLLFFLCFIFSILYRFIPKYCFPSNYTEGRSQASL